jgi:acetylornithine deacetylase/succinyl-diaminopimelate desuccinylase-like protein
MFDLRAATVSLMMAWALTFTGSAIAQTQSLTRTQQQLREIHKELVEINTTNSAGSCTEAAEAMAKRLRDVAIPAADVHVIVPPGATKKGNLVARYRGNGAKRPILLLAHLDVVEAKPEDWQRDPFQLIEENGYLYGRGSFDDKAMAAIFVANLVRYREEGYKPDRDLVVALTCDEELISLFNGVEYLLKHHRDAIDADLALNEGAAGMLDKDGSYVRMTIQAGEKVFQSFFLEITNPGGHSSVPTKDNAIYRMADALSRLGKFDFPVNLSEITRAYFERMSTVESGQVAADMKAILRDPPDADALARLSQNPFNNATLRSTCVATMLQAGHAQNALPQRAQATVNCRILPNDSPEEVHRTLVRVLGDDGIKITPANEPQPSPLPPHNPDLVRAVETVSATIWPGIPVVKTLSTGATDGRFLNNTGIPTYGVTGLFRDQDGSGIHGLNERIRVRTLYEGQEFLYRVVKGLGGG